MRLCKSTLILMFVALAGCASGDFDDPRIDSGRTPGRGDSGVRTDAGRDTVSPDVDAGEVGDVPLTDTDVSTDVVVDTPQFDVPEEDVSTPWGDVPDGVSAAVRAGIEASRSGMLAFCDSCNGNFGSDPELCLAEFTDGGFEPDECELTALAGAADGDAYATCVGEGYSELQDCVEGGASGCALCQNSLNLVLTNCRRDNPAAVERLDACP